MRTVDLEMKEPILAGDSQVYFTTPHFEGYPAVLVQLDRIGARELKQIITEAWLARAAEPAVRDYLQRHGGRRK